MSGKSIGFLAAVMVFGLLAVSQLFDSAPGWASSPGSTEASSQAGLQANPQASSAIVAEPVISGKSHHALPQHPISRSPVSTTHALRVSKSKALSSVVCTTESKIGQELDLPIYKWFDPGKVHRGIIVAVPGMTLYAFAWNDMARYLANRGYIVFSLDQRGFGRWRTEAAKFGGDSKIQIGQSQQDLLDLVTDLRQAQPKEKLYLLGESLGSNLALNLIAEHPDLADGAILGSPCYKTRMHAKPLRWAADFAKTVVKPNRFINLEPYSAPYLTNDPSLARACDSDPLIYRKISASELIKIDVMNDRAIDAARKLPSNFPLLIIAGAKDAMFKSTELPKAVEKFGTHNVQLHLLAGKGHLLMEHQLVQPVIGTIIDTWLAQQPQPNAQAKALVSSPNANLSRARPGSNFHNPLSAGNSLSRPQRNAQKEQQ